MIKIATAKKESNLVASKKEYETIYDPIHVEFPRLF
jgi:hypothetical protein